MPRRSTSAAARWQWSSTVPVSPESDGVSYRLGSPRAGGGGGNRAAAPAQINGLTLKQAVEKLYAAIDEYIDS